MRWIPLIILPLLLIGCGGDDESPVTSDTSPPIVVSTSPEDMEDNVAVDAVVAAVFSEDMNPSTIAASTFLVSDGVTGTVSYGNKTATLTPSTDLEENFTYTATVTTAVKDEAGNALAADYVWTFITAGDAIMPLKVGNFWQAQVTSYDRQGLPYASATQTNLIIGDTMIADNRWYIGSTGVFANRPDGLYQHSANSRTYLFLKYPATVGQSYAGDPDAAETIVVKSINTSVTVSAGTYSCYHYESRKSGDPTLNNYFYCPNVGPIRLDTYWDVNDDPLVIKARWELDTLDLQ